MCERMIVERMQHHRADVIRVLLVAPSMIDHFSHFLLSFRISFCFRKSAFRLSKLVSLHALPLTIEPKSVLV